MRWLPVALLLLGCTPSDPPARLASIEAVPPTLEPEPEPEPPAIPGCDPATIAAARTTLDTALTQQVDPAHLADCRPEALSCASERAPIEARDSCQIVVTHGSERWEVVVVPRPATGAPTRLEIWVDEAGEEAGRVQIGGSTWGVVAGVEIEGRGGYASHTHGGAPAKIGGARFIVRNHRDEPVALTLTATRWLVAYSCELPRTEEAQPKPAGVALDDGLIDGVMTVEIPAGATETVRVGHEVQSAYMVHCDRFASAATFEIDGAQIEVIAEHRVIRREPMRHP